MQSNRFSCCTAALQLEPLRVLLFLTNLVVQMKQAVREVQQFAFTIDIGILV